MNVSRFLAAAALALLAASSFNSCRKEPFQLLHEAVTEANKSIAVGDTTYNNSMLEISKIDFDEIDNTVRIEARGGSLFMTDPKYVLAMLSANAPEFVQRLEEAKANIIVSYMQPGLKPAEIELTYPYDSI